MDGVFDPVCLARVQCFPLVSAACPPAAEPMVDVLVLDFAAVSQAMECDALRHAIEVAGAVWQAAEIAGVEVVLLLVVDVVAVVEEGDLVGVVVLEKLEGIGGPPLVGRVLTQWQLLLRAAQWFVILRGLLQLWVLDGCLRRLWCCSCRRLLLVVCLWQMVGIVVWMLLMALECPTGLLLMVGSRLDDDLSGSAERGRVDSSRSEGRETLGGISGPCC